MISTETAVPRLSADDLVLALDLGTTNVKALLVTLGTGEISARGAVRVGIECREGGIVEQDPDEIWSAALGAIDSCLASVDHPPVAAVTIANQREAVTAWDRQTGRVLGPLIGWQDTRQAALCEELAGAAAEIFRRTGLRLDPAFSAPKMRVLLEALSPAQRQRAVCGTVDSLALRRLTGRDLTEAGNASRTMLFGAKALDWDPALLEIFGIERANLPEVRASLGDFGVVTAPIAGLRGVPVVGVFADSHSALYYHSAGRPEAVKATYGTGSSVMANVGGDAPAGLTKTLAWVIGRPHWALEGNIAASGAALEWAANLLTGGSVSELEKLALGGADGVQLVPAFSGLGSPYLDPQARAVLTGFTGTSGPAEVARAAFLAVAQQICDVLDALGGQATQVSADGGAARSDFLMRLQADLAGRDFRVAEETDASALGVVRAVADAQGDTGMSEAWQERAGRGRLVRPEWTQPERESRRHPWADAVRKARLTTSQRER